LAHAEIASLKAEVEVANSREMDLEARLSSQAAELQSVRLKSRNASVYEATQGTQHKADDGLHLGTLIRGHSSEDIGRIFQHSDIDPEPSEVADVTACRDDVLLSSGSFGDEPEKSRAALFSLVCELQDRLRVREEQLATLSHKTNALKRELGNREASLEKLEAHVQQAEREVAYQSTACPSVVVSLTETPAAESLRTVQEASGRPPCSAMSLSDTSEASIHKVRASRSVSPLPVARSSSAAGFANVQLRRGLSSSSPFQLQASELLHGAPRDSWVPPALPVWPKAGSTSTVLRARECGMAAEAWNHATVNTLILI